MCLGNACSIVLRGSTQQILDEAERSLHDALCVLSTHMKEARTVPGAGAAEMLMATAVKLEAQKVSSPFDSLNLYLLIMICGLRSLGRSHWLWRHSGER